MAMESADICKAVMAVAVCVGFFGILGTMVVVGSTMALGEAGLIMTGYLGGAFTNIVGYYFGSSAGSAAKDLLLRKGDSK